MRKYNRKLSRRIFFALAAWGLIPTVLILAILVIIAAPFLSLGWLLDLLDCGENDDNDDESGEEDEI